MDETRTQYAVMAKDTDGVYMSSGPFKHREDAQTEMDTVIRLGYHTADQVYVASRPVGPWTEEK